MHGSTKEDIKWAFIELLNERPLSKISVKSIVNSCNVSRNTFYYHFQDVPSLLEEIITDALDDLIKSNTTGASLNLCITKAYEFACKNRKAVYHIYHSVDREVYENFLMKMCEHAAKTYIGEFAADKDISEKDSKALMHIMKCQFFGLCLDWTKSGMKDNFTENYQYTVMLFCKAVDAFLQNKPQI